MAAPFPVMRKTRSAVLAAALGLGVSGCESSGSVSGFSADMGKIGGLLLHEIGGIGSSGSVPRERAAAIPYATMGVRLGDSDQAMFVLASKNGDDLMWLGGKSIAVVTRHGRVVRTVGFNHNVSGVHAAEGVKQDLTQPVANYLYDFGEQSRYGIPVRCTRQNIGTEKVTIIGVPHDTSHVAEDCNASGMDWNFRNEFWVDSTGYVWKSRQFVEPRVDPLTLEVFRPAAG
jgi:hypothetical protein